MSDAAKSSNLFASLRRLVSTVIELAQVRLQLLATELEQQKLRILDSLLLALVGLLLLGVGLVLLCGFIVLLFQEGYRLPALGVLTVLFLGGAAAAVLAARQRIQSPGGAFNATASELARDQAALNAGTEAGNE